MKSLVAILHFNTTKYTDALYEMLKPFEENVYDLIVIDNGSCCTGLPRYSYLFMGKTRKGHSGRKQEGLVVKYFIRFVNFRRTEYSGQIAGVILFKICTT